MKKFIDQNVPAYKLVRGSVLGGADLNPGPQTGIQISPSGRLFAASGGGFVHVWDIETTTLQLKVSGSSAVWDGDDALIVYSAYKAAGGKVTADVKQWQIKGAKEEVLYEGGPLHLVTKGDLGILVIDQTGIAVLENGALVPVVPLKDLPHIICAALSQDQSLLAFIDLKEGKSILRIVDINAKKVVFERPALSRERICFSNSTLFVVNSGVLKKISEKGEEKTLKLPGTGFLVSEHTEGVVVLGAGALWVYDEKAFRTMTIPGKRPYAFDASGVLAVYSDNQLGIHIVDTASETIREPVQRGHTAAVLCGAVLDGVLYTGSEDGRIIQWDGEEASVQFDVGSPVSALCASNDELVAGTRSGELLWLNPDLTLQRRVNAHKRVVTSIQVSDTGVISTAMDKTILFWDEDATKPVKTLRGEQEGYLSLAVGQDQNIIGGREGGWDRWNREGDLVEDIPSEGQWGMVAVVKDSQVVRIDSNNVVTAPDWETKIETSEFRSATATDFNLLACGNWGGSVFLLNGATGEVVYKLWLKRGVIHALVRGPECVWACTSFGVVWQLLIKQ